MATPGQRRSPMKWFRRFRPTAVLLLTLLPGLAATFSVGLYIARARWIGWLNGGGPRCYLVGQLAP